MHDWLIATPAWGERCVWLFVNQTLPAIRAAAARVSGNVRFLVHTDDPKRIKEELGSLPPHMVLPVPKGDSPHVKLGECHRKAIELTGNGECIAFINADMAPSVEVFEAAERRFAEGKRLIMMAATRTCDGVPPVGARSADLLRWTMQHRHPIISRCFWGADSGTTVPWAIYFQRDDDIVLRGFHLHPFAVMKDRGLSFQRKTIDADLPDQFTREEIHLVTDADEASFAEISEPWRTFKLLNGPITVESAAKWAKNAATPVHQWFFTHRIAICGKGEDIGDAAVCDDILRAL
jgi:hypothetical protein